MNLDEVYQAALAAGSGGIRFSSTTKRIQLMDENKNWVDWKIFDPYVKMEFVLLSSAAQNPNFSNYTFTHNGLYIAMCTVYNNNSGYSSVTTQATTVATINAGNLSGRRCHIKAFKAIAGQTLSMSISGTAVNSNIAMCYLGDYFDNLSLSESYSHADSGSVSISTSVPNSLVIASTGSGDASSSVGFNITNENTNLITDGKIYGFWTNAYESGSCTATAAARNGTGVVAVLALS